MTRKIVSALLALTFVLGLLLGCGFTTASAENNENVVGTLYLLNMKEEEYLKLVQSRIIGADYLADQGVFQRSIEGPSNPEPMKIVFYDTLTDMLMALQAGDITAAEMPQSTAKYLCANNDAIEMGGLFDLENADEFSKEVAFRLGVGYSFLTTEDKTGLRDELNQAITEMKEDGTMDALIKAYITDAAATDPEPVEFAKMDGETITVAITGEVPPMDYIAPDGTPAGFNTAVLAELGKRLNKNFELVQVGSMGRASALSSGKVDLVFWTSGTDGRGKRNNPSVNQATFVEEQQKLSTDEQNAVMQAMTEKHGMKGGAQRFKDVPDGTITTQSYFSDVLMMVVMK